MHCKGHSRDGSKVAKGNQLADCQARKAALYETPSLQTPLIWTGPVEQEKPQYTDWSSPGAGGGSQLLLGNKSAPL